jgi:hypothetical protein
LINQFPSQAALRTCRITEIRESCVTSQSVICLEIGSVRGDACRKPSVRPSGSTTFSALSASVRITATAEQFPFAGAPRTFTLPAESMHTSGATQFYQVLLSDPHFVCSSRISHACYVHRPSHILPYLTFLTVSGLLTYLRDLVPPH